MADSRGPAAQAGPSKERRSAVPEDADEQVQQLLKLEAIGQLAGGIAHDFNNLLTVITGYAETLLPTFEPSDPRVGDLMEIRRAADRAAVLTQQLLAFSRRQVLRPGLLDLNDVARDVSSMVSRLVGKQIELRVDVAAAPATVMADRGQIEQVLLNLAVNARDAMPRGGMLEFSIRVVDVSEERATQRYPMRAGRYVLIEVRDTGVGMAPEVRQRVFEPFFTTKGPGEGTGIGLSTVYGIVKQSGGFVFVDSTPGHGSVFDVYLPYVEAEAQAATAPADEAPSRAACTILLVDDYRRIRELARRVLTRQGYRVLSAGSGTEALQVAEEYDGTIDVLLTDVVMPGLSGPQLAGQLQRQRPDVVPIYMSGHAGAALESLGVDDASAPFLRKPFSPSALTQKVREVLARLPLRTAKGA